LADLRKEILAELRKRADPKRAEGAKRYFKETINPIGVPVPECRKLASEIWAKEKPIGAEAIFPITEKLLTEYWEAGAVGLDLLHRTRKEWMKGTFSIFSKWLDEGRITNWAHCDELSNHSICFIVEKYPELGEELVGWTKSPNRWKRRAAAVTLILPARRGERLELAFRIAAPLLPDPDDMVQKGVGWLLKEEGRKNEKEVIAFLKGKKTSRLVLRLAAEKMTKSGKRTLLSQD
jgi:3-methyladenine DNA glycosylase AlkD